MSYVSVKGDLCYKKQVNMFRVMPTVLSKEMIYLDLNGVPRIFKPEMYLYYAEPVKMNRLGQYEPVGKRLRSSCLVTNEELMKMSEIEDSIYVHLSSVKDKLIKVNDKELRDYFKLYDETIDFGDYLVIHNDGGLIPIKAFDMNSLYYMYNES